MNLIVQGSPVPNFRLKTEGGEDFTKENLSHGFSVLVFYPFAFSPVCTDQLKFYDDKHESFAALDAKVYGISCDSTWSQKAFRESLNVEIPQLSDFEPKGETARQFGVYRAKDGFSERALVITTPESVVGWSFCADSPGDLPTVEFVLEALTTVVSGSKTETD